MPGLRVRVFFRNSSRGTVYCSRASAGTQTAWSRPPARAPSTERRRYSYSRPAPSTGRSMKSRGGNTAAVRPRAFRSSAKWVASASPGVTMQSTRSRSFCRAAYSSARPAGGRPNSAAGPGFAKLAAIFWYSWVAFNRASYMENLLSCWDDHLKLPPHSLWQWQRNDYFYLQQRKACGLFSAAFSREGS